MKRIAFKFTPYSWVKFEWRPASNLRRWLSVCGLIFLFLLAELNTFYLKFVLWMPPEHYLVLLRLVFFVNVGRVAMREIYDFMDDLDITLRYKEIRRQKQEYKPEDVSLRNGEATSDLANRNISKPKRL